MPVFTLLTLLCVLSGVSAAPASSPAHPRDHGRSRPANAWLVGDPRYCLERLWKSEDAEDRTQMFQVLPGLGWDNLRNMETAPVLSYNYSRCRLTDDGKFLIPDNVFIIPLKNSKLQTFAELIDEWKELKSVTSRTINANPGFSMAGSSISGTFSREFSKVKDTQIQDKSATVRVQLRYNRYKSKLRPGSSLTPEFKAALFSIAAHMEMNQTDRARYESEVLVRNFGTHVLTSVTAGAGLIKEDYVKRSFVEEHRENMAAMLHSASGVFKDTFSLSLGVSDSKKETTTDHKGYMGNLTHSTTETLGGTVFLAGGMTADDWADDLDSNLVAMDRSGDPLYLLVTQAALPELPLYTVERLETMVRDAVQLYYSINIIPGCTDPTYSKFSITANFDDGSCKTQAETGLALGGIYQQCEPRGERLVDNPCFGAQRSNALTGEQSCPPGFTAVLLHEGDGPGRLEFRKKCKWCTPWHKCCKTHGVLGYAHYKTYWCAGRVDGLHAETDTEETHSQQDKTVDTSGAATASSKTKPAQTGEKKQQSSEPAAGKSSSSASKKVSADHKSSPKQSKDRLGYNFGGVFTRSAENLVTSTKACPDGFYPRQIFFDLKVCISDDYEKASPLAVPFGGFFSCSMGNPLASRESELKSKISSSPESWPKRCPTGYSQHLATEVSGCAIHYCAESGYLAGAKLPNVRFPPFSQEPPETDDRRGLVFDEGSMTWIPNPDLLTSDDEQQTDLVLQAAGSVPGAASAGSLGEQEDTDKRSPGEARKGYVEIRAEVLAGILAFCLSVVAVTVVVALYKLRARPSKEKTTQPIPQVTNTEVTPLRPQGATNPAFEQTEEAATDDDTRQRSSYTNDSSA